jgi:integrase
MAYVATSRPCGPDSQGRKVKQIIRVAGLRDELTFTSFRHGGLTEAGDAELTDAQIRAQSRHTSSKVLSRYVKRTMRQVAAGAQKRRAERTKRGQLSE